MTPKTYPFNIAITIAFVGLCVTFCVWFGTINKTIDTQTRLIQTCEQQLNDLIREQRIQDEELAVLKTLLNERTKRP